MKRFYVLLFALILILSFNGCTGVKSTVRGLDNESFLSFYSDKSDLTDVEVRLGNSETFSAEVNKVKRNSTNFQKRPNGKVYSINPGTHEIRVIHNGQIIYSQKFFISNQETKIIKL